MIKKAPIEAWVARKIGLERDVFTRHELQRYQLAKIHDTMRWALLHSRFYQKLFKGFSAADITGLQDLQRLPFTYANDLRGNASQFLCVSQDDISRVVTLDTSGTTGDAKRIYFTDKDQQLTVDYFQYGMAAVTDKGDRVLILFPGERPGSLGALLATALKRLGTETIPYGIVRDIPAVLEVMRREKVDCVVGIPTQVFAVARYAEHAGIPIRLKGVLLGSDHVSGAVAGELKRLWGCPVFDHYGMTEMGLGGGTECAACNGYHLHEADIYFEIVDPLTGEAVPEGQPGEVVVTTLTRRGMPLIRYRTGDISRFLTEPCFCGATQWRLDKITGRKDRQVLLKGNGCFSMPDLDEALFAVDKVVDFTAEVDNVQNATQLSISVVVVGQPGETAEPAVIKALDAVPAIKQAREDGKLTVKAGITSCGDMLVPRAAKRAILELR